MVSAFELFTVGLGPSSSHTSGPMEAARRFAMSLPSGEPGGGGVSRVAVELRGSLALTGRGHGTPAAVIAGLAGDAPETADPRLVGERVEAVRRHGSLRLASGTSVRFDADRDLTFAPHRRPAHPNELELRAYGIGRAAIARQTWWSIGGGSIVRAGEPLVDGPAGDGFSSGAELLERCAEAPGRSVSEVVLGLESRGQPETAVLLRVDLLLDTMEDCIERGLRAEGPLPGGLGVFRRAADLHARLMRQPEGDALHAMDWVNLWALAVNEQNAAGQRVVTAPTNGAAGIVPAVLRYLRVFLGGEREDARRFLLAATAVGSIVKTRASISGADVGCQGEVGTAAAMAAAGLAEAQGARPAQVEHAAEIALEHHLGLTCDPVGGLVQIPCIERNAIGAIKAINAARLAMHDDDGRHRVSLDQVIETLRQTGADMKREYKETALGGLAVNVVAC